MIFHFVFEAARRHPLTDIGQDCEPYYIVMVTDACPSVRTAFAEWRGLEIASDEIVWIPADQWSAFVDSLAANRIVVASG